MSRRINLTRIHAIGWYGYHDSFDVRGDLLIAGVTGSGKSVLLDLIQLVLLGDQRKTRYNKSATGERSKRDLIGYCLGDTKQDIAGARQFMRDKGITYVALEFTWPGGQRVETWGLRIEFESAVRKDPSRTSPFYVPCSLDRNDFIDDERKPLDYSRFKHMVEEQRMGRIFSGPEEYRREMALNSHLNFDRQTLDYLLPAAMSFSFMDSFNEFCREYILPAEDVDIKSVRDSYLAFQNFQRELALLRDQLDCLEKIHAIDQERICADRDRIVTGYLEAEFRRDIAQDALESGTDELRQLDAELEQESLVLEEAKAQVAIAKSQLDAINNTFHESESGRLYFHLANRKQELEAKIKPLRDIGTSIESARDARVRGTSSWLAKIEALSLPLDTAMIQELRVVAARLSSAPLETTRECVKSLSAKVGAALQLLGDDAKPKSDKATRLRQELERNQRALSAVRSGMPTDRMVLLTELNKRLHRRSAEPAAQALWQLCEVNDEDWRPAIEVAFTQKYAVIVEPQDYAEAERFYYNLREDARGESLIDPSQLSTVSRCEGSLAEKIDAKHPIARSIVDYIFGDVICVTEFQEFTKYRRAILPDGLMANRPFVQRLSHYDNHPCIGKRGLEKQIAWLNEQINLLQSQIGELTPSLEAWIKVRDMAGQHGLESDNLHDDLELARQLPEVERELEECLGGLARIRTPDFETKQKERQGATVVFDQVQEHWSMLLQSSRKNELEPLLERVEKAKRDLETRELKFRAIRDKEDVSAHLTRMEELHREILEAYPDEEIAAEQFNDLHAAATLASETKRIQLVSERRLLAAHSGYGTYYSDFDPESATNDHYDQRLARIQEGEIRSYEVKAQREEINWQQLLQMQVLQKLQQKLVQAERLIGILKEELRDPIGNSRYKITSTPNRDSEYQVYRRLIEISSYAKEGELFFATVDSEIQETVRKLFEQIVKQPECKEVLDFLDYRKYSDYDMLVEDVSEPDQSPSSLNKHSGMFSGGENQAPFFIAILACYLRAYRRYERRRHDPSLALVPIDEAFSKLSGDCIHDCIAALRHLDLQGLFSMSTGNIPYAIDDCDQVIAVHKHITSVGKKKHIRNIGVTLTREAAHARFAEI